VYIQPDQKEKFVCRRGEIRAIVRHLLPGTIARYMARSKEKPKGIRVVVCPAQ
jgi:hypothetical protein